MTIAYVVTSKSNDLHGDMALVSMMSARITNPGWRIVLICDRKTMDAATGCKHRMLEVCDEVVAVDTPEGDPTFVNRWIKSQAIRWVSDACLLLDTDTLIRRSLDDLPNLVEHVGAVPNYNTANTSEQIWEEDVEELRRMDWPVEFAFYANGGALFFKPTALVRHFFGMWHFFYLESVKSLRRHRDQPALNSALIASSVPLTKLPDSYNFQLRHIIKGWSEAAIWHYYSSVGTEGTFFEHIVHKAPELSNDELGRLVKVAVSASHPFVAYDDVAIAIANYSGESGHLKQWQRKWLQTDKAELHVAQLNELESIASNYLQSEDRLQSLRSELQDCKAQLCSIKASFSWRLTAPFRMLERSFRGAIARLRSV